MVGRWLLFVISTDAMSWAAFTPALSRDARFFVAFIGAIVFVITIYPSLKARYLED